MDTFFNILMVVCFFPIAPILYFVLRNHTKPKKNLIINVTLPLEAQEDEQVLAYCKTYRKRLGIAALAFTVIFPVVFLIQSFSIVLTFFMSWLTIVISVMYGIYSKYHMKLKRLKKERGWASKSGADAQVDEDDHWIGGILYYNPNNKQTLVSERVGINMSVNIAKPAGKVLIAIAALTLIAMPFFGIAFMPMEFTPLRIEVTDQAVIMRHSTTISIDLDDIVEVELREELRPIARQVGTNLPTLYAGRWLISNIGTATLRLNPQHPPFIVIKTEGTTYIFGTSDVERTFEAFAELQQRFG